MFLRTTGVALLQARALDLQPERVASKMMTCGQPMETLAPDRLNYLPMDKQPGHRRMSTSPRGKDAVGAPIDQIVILHTDFDAAMARFLDNQQVPHTHTGQGETKEKNKG